MASYQTFTSARVTEPDYGTLLATLRAQDPTAGIQHNVGERVWTIKKSNPWTLGQITFVQNAIDTSPETTPQRQAQNEIDNWPISMKALVLALIDQLNVIRAALPVPKPPMTPEQALSAVRAKAATL